MCGCEGMQLKYKPKALNISPKYDLQENLKKKGTISNLSFTNYFKRREAAASYLGRKLNQLGVGLVVNGGSSWVEWRFSLFLPWKLGHFHLWPRLLFPRPLTPQTCRRRQRQRQALSGGAFHEERQRRQGSLCSCCCHHQKHHRQEEVQSAQGQGYCSPLPGNYRVLQGHWSRCQAETRPHPIGQEERRETWLSCLNITTLYSVCVMVSHFKEQFQMVYACI